MDAKEYIKYQREKGVTEKKIFSVVSAMEGEAKAKRLMGKIDNPFEDLFGTILKKK